MPRARSDQPQATRVSTFRGGRRGFRRARAGIFSRDSASAGTKPTFHVMRARGDGHRDHPRAPRLCWASTSPSCWQTAVVHGMRPRTRVSRTNAHTEVAIRCPRRRVRCSVIFRRGSGKGRTDVGNECVGEAQNATRRRCRRGRCGAGHGGPRRSISQRDLVPRLCS